MEGCLKRRRVLLVDDCSEIIDVCMELLKQDYDVVGTASDGQTAIELCADAAPDVIVMDICMPGLNGIEVARHLRNCGCRAVIVFLSEAVELTESALEIAGTSFVRKILIGQDLRIGIREALIGRVFVSRIA